VVSTRIFDLSHIDGWDPMVVEVACSTSFNAFNTQQLPLQPSSAPNDQELQLHATFLSGRDSNVTPPPLIKVVTFEVSTLRVA
jgi:hypothetical protein